MEPWARKTNYCRLLLVSLSWSSILLSPLPRVSYHAIANAQTATTASPSNIDQIYKRLRDLELKILGKHYDSDLVTARLERLEKKLFGNEKTGEIKHRLDALLIASELTQTASPGADWADDENSESVHIDSSKPVAANTIKSKIGSGDNAGLNKQVSQLETEIFGKNYVGDTLPERLSRLEQAIFPQEKAYADKSLPERVHRLTNAVPPSREVAKKSSSMQDAEAPAPSRASAYTPKIDMVTPNVPSPPEPKPDSKTKTIAESKDVDFGPYMADIQRKIKAGWYPPKGEETRKVEVVFKVLSDGTVKDVRITKSSGHATADAMALKAVGDASPLPPLPDGAPKDVDIQFNFDYTVHARRAGSEDVDYGPYIADLERRLKRAWFPPKMAGEKKVVKVTFVVSRAGQMSKLRVLKSSGAALCDQAALKAVENASPFRPLPEGVGSSIEEVPMFVSFSYDGTAVDNRSFDSLGEKKVTARTKDDRTLADSNPEIFDGLKRSLEELWRPNPSSTKRICELQFWTDSTNTEEVKVAKSSGDAGFDEQARRAVKALLPISVPKSSYTLLRGRFGSDRSIVVCAEDEADFGPYMAAIQRKIKGNWHPPKGDETRRVNIVFKLLQDGTIKNPFVKDSTGAETADAAGLAAVTASSPLPALPANSPNEVDIQFTLDYNVFKSASDAPGTFRKFPESSQSTFEVTQEDVNLLKEALKSSKQLEIPQDRPYLPGVLPF